MSSHRLCGCLFVGVAVLFAPALSARTDSGPVPSATGGGAVASPYLLYGQEVLLVGCACEEPFCKEGPGRFAIRAPPLTTEVPRAGGARHAPEERHCPYADEEGAEGKVTKEMDGFLGAGTSATVRVVFMKTNMNGQLLQSWTGSPIREGQHVAIFEASEATRNAEHLSWKRVKGCPQKPLVELTKVEFPWRYPKIEEWDGGEADENDAILEDGLVQIAPIVTGYNCGAFGDADGRCAKYGKLADVFHFRAIAEGPVPTPPQKSKPPADLIAGAFDNFITGASTNACDHAVLDAVKRDGFHWGGYKCKCPNNMVIGGSLDCQQLNQQYSENGKGRKFNPAPYEGKGCSCE